MFVDARNTWFFQNRATRLKSRIWDTRVHKYKRLRDDETVPPISNHYGEVTAFVARQCVVVFVFDESLALLQQW